MINRIAEVKVVALFTRAWIEIAVVLIMYDVKSVALFTRAWIEISATRQREKGKDVALFTRAWIEIFASIAEYNAAVRRPLHEGVD